MRQKLLAWVLILTVVFTIPIAVSAAGYTPPTQLGVPQGVAVVFNNDIETDTRWSFDIGLNASSELRAFVAAIEDARMEAAGYDSVHVDIQGDYKLDNGMWRSEMPGYDEWVFTQDSQFSEASGNWASNCNIYDEYFSDVLPNGVLPGGAAYFDTHTLYFRVRFAVNYVDNNVDEHVMNHSGWSAVVSYNNKTVVEDPAALINHAPTLLSAELKKNEKGEPYLDMKATPSHADIQHLNSISNQRVYTNVWLRANNGAWVDLGSYLWMREQFDVAATEYFGLDTFDAAVFEVKFRYSFEHQYYPASGKSGVVQSPFSNIIRHGMPAYEGAAGWATTELDKAAEYELITDRIKGNMSEKVTREEFAEIAVKLYEKYTGITASVGTAGFTDTTNPEILKAANLGLVSGTGNNKYTPQRLVSRMEMTTILLRALKVMKPAGDFSATGVPKFVDDSLIQPWAVNGVYFCAKAQIVKGLGNNRFDPVGSSTRQEAVIVCSRAYEFFQK